ncbi:Crp/Fnr family transcriptional regulator [Sphingosinicella rhizophila]|uniref:Crp/Fnr family transcriptional regulator n=1 Tax=Sphingosinicella rhizophila TaxID=3050082 RepID=A0ABU3Q9L6_9SPHN|nr:Crp/Fnr family transcriptional regulator [Sphingosinicella sp. GR2756]MDT9600084.1 Crp/Fnr family transcriptional regulator [Sphingosinicella sp. GR2756]
MTTSQNVLEPMLRKFELRAPLDESDRQAFLALPCRVQMIEANVYILREGDRPDRSCMIVSGFAVRHKVTVEGARQIVSLHIPGDFLDLDGSLLTVADHNLQTLTRGEMAFIPRSAVRELILDHPKLGMAMWIDTLIDSSIFREWVANVGRRDARSRIAHLLCEFSRRLEIAGLTESYGYELPMTQEQLADATGLISVHVNRVLKRLAEEGLIQRTRRHVAIPNWERLRRVAGFNETYLHLNQIDAAMPAARAI